jgi:hypothetical protein
MSHHHHLHPQQQQHHHHQQQQYNKPPIVVTENDVLSGRGVNIAAHPGNERFRTLVTTRADDSYCESYSASEKKAVAEEIVQHISSLNPPGRFLKREGRGQVSRGLNGPWEELTRREAIKKTCQALRDCNRSDRESYASGVAPPEDVKAVAEQLAMAGVALKERAAKAAEEVAQTMSARLREAMESAGVPEETIEEQLRRQRADPTYVIPGFSMTASGDFVPILAPHQQHSAGVYPPSSNAGMMSPDGMPLPPSLVSNHHPHHEMMPGGLTGIYSMYPHPAVDAAPINMEAHLAARAAAGYVHPDDRLAMEKKRIMKEVEEEDIRGIKEEEQDDEEVMDAAAAAEEAAAAVANLDSSTAAEDDEAAAGIAVAMAQDAFDKAAPPQDAEEFAV